MYIHGRSRLERVCAAVSTLYVIVFTATVWFSGVSYNRGWIPIIGVSMAVFMFALCSLFLLYWHRKRTLGHEARNPGRHMHV